MGDVVPHGEEGEEEGEGLLHRDDVVDHGDGVEGVEDPRGEAHLPGEVVPADAVDQVRVQPGEDNVEYSVGEDRRCPEGPHQRGLDEVGDDSPVKVAAVDVPHPEPGEADLEAKIRDLPVMIRVGVPVHWHEGPRVEAGGKGDSCKEQQRVGALGKDALQ